MPILTSPCIISVTLLPWLLSCQDVRSALKTSIMDENKYKCFENILTKVNQKCIASSETDKKRNNILMAKIVDQIIAKMRKADPLFDGLYRNKYYGGSYYDNLKVGKPDEYDLDMLMALPKFIDAKIKSSNKPGYVHLHLTNLTIGDLVKREDIQKFSRLVDFIDKNNFLCAKKILRWIESLITQAMNEFPKENGLSKISYDTDAGDGGMHHVFVKFVKGGPAMTLLLDGEYDNHTFHLDIDLVACFVFTQEEWPEGYRKNPTKDRNTFFVVPKTPSDGESRYWRLSFQEQERELMSSKGKNSVLKPTIRLFKKMRDHYNHKIASYFIKTVFLWEIEKDKEVWQKSLSCVFILMMEKYATYLQNGNIPYYWNKNLNLIQNLKPETSSNIANKIRYVIQDVNRNLESDPFTIAKCLLPEPEIEMMRAEVNIGKKYRRQVSSGVLISSPSRSSRSPTPQGEIEAEIESSVPSPLRKSSSRSLSPIRQSQMPANEKLARVESVTSNASSVQSSFEEIAHPNSAILETLERIEMDNKKILDMCQFMMNKIGKLEKNIDYLMNEKLKKPKEEEEDPLVIFTTPSNNFNVIL